MSAFGPYKNVEEIDFTGLGEKGVFLISGKTGAGKTSIFDAISYALFGRKTSDDRKGDLIRSDFSDPDTKTYVILEFIHRNKKYTVTRSPQQEISKTRGTGTTKVNAQAELKCGDEPPISGPTAVDSKIQELLGIDYNQFKQISMIAQGEFRKLLTAKSGERKAIFQKIFMTGAYANLEVLIAARAKELGLKARELKNSMKSEISRITLDENSSAFEKMNELDEESAAFRIEDVIEIVKLGLDEDGVSLDVFQAEIEDLDDSLRDKNAELTIMKERNRLLDDMNRSIEDLSSLKEKEDEIREKKLHVERADTAVKEVKPALENVESAKVKQRKDADELKGLEGDRKETDSLLSVIKTSMENDEADRLEAEKLMKKAEALKEGRGKLEKRLEYEKDLKNTLREFEAAEEKTDALEKKISSREADLARMRESISGISEDEISLHEAETVLDKLADIEGLFSRLDRDEIIFEDAVDELKAVRREYSSLRDGYDALEREKLRAERLLEENRAGILAKKLVRGQACPVCGSVEHPNPAPLANEVLSEAEFEALSKKCEKMRNDKNEANELCIRIKADVDNLEKGIDSLLKDIMEKAGALGIKGADAGEVRNALEDEKKSVSERKTLLVNRLEEMKNVRDSLIPKLEGELEESRGVFEQTKTERDGLLRKTDAIKIHLSEIPSQEYDTVDEFDLAIKDYSDRSSRITDEIQARLDRKNEADRTLSNLDGQIKALKGQIKKDETEVSRSLEIFYRLLKDKGIMGISEAEELIDADVSLEREEVEQYEKRTGELETEIRTLKDQTSGEHEDTSSLEAEIKEIETKLEEYRAKTGEIAVRVDSNEKTKKSLEKLLIKNGKLADQIAHTEVLRKLIKGQSPGKTRMSLEEYIQVAGFEGIIKAANLRLKPISSGQFELFRTENTGNQSNMALSLEILDNYTGKKRPVNTLSGGESFKASLSMALGLSDYITSGLGGVEIDTLFIDEGFGSLDEQSVIEAVDMLNSLSTNGKLIGIISHREELKERIQKKIIIDKSPSGSSIRLDLGE